MLRSRERVRLSPPGARRPATAALAAANAVLADAVARIVPLPIDGLRPAILIAQRVEIAAGESTGMHRHGCLELGQIATGSLLVTTADGGEHEIAAGATLVAAPGRAHRWRNPAGPCLLFSLMIDLAPSAAGAGMALAVIDQRAANPCLPPDHEARALVEALCANQVVPPALIAARVQHLALRQLSRLLARAATAPALIVDRVVIVARAFLSAHLAEPIGIHDAAAAAGVGERHLGRCFRAAGLPTPSQVLEDLRLSRARQLLAQGTLSVAAVADACGFSTASYFARRFRHRTGLAPAAWDPERYQSTTPAGPPAAP